MYKLFTDTDTDITPRVAEQYGYTLISMPYSMETGVDVYPYEDWDEFDDHAFYDILRGGVLPKTFALSPQRYIEYFEPALREGMDILYVHFSAAMSGTFGAMKLAWDQLSERYPERRLYTVDTKAITICSYAIVREIGDMAKAGASAEQILRWAEKEVDKYAVYFFADDLKFFARSGRVGNLAATMGGILGIRPIINMNEAGTMQSVGKAVGRKRALAALLSYVDQLQEDILSHKVIIGHADALPLAKELEQKLKETYGEALDTEIVAVNPTAGSHCGPDTVGVCFHAKHR